MLKLIHLVGKWCNTEGEVFFFLYRDRLNIASSLVVWETGCWFLVVRTSTSISAAVVFKSHGEGCRAHAVSLLKSLVRLHHSTPYRRLSANTASSVSGFS